MQGRKLYSPSKFLVKFNTPQKDIKFRLRDLPHDHSSFGHR